MRKVLRMRPVLHVLASTILAGAAVAVYQEPSGEASCRDRAHVFTLRRK
jgi:hypothetical protein